MKALVQKTAAIFTRFGGFIGDTRAEMKKVTWPDKNEVMNTTVVVIVTSFFFGLFLFAVDVAIEYGVTFVRNRF